MKKERRTYPLLSYTDFSTQLLDTYDLDPIYYMLVRADLADDVLYRWLLAYWCYYHAGVASLLAEITDSNEYYERMYDGVKDWPRGAERRYFRGKDAYRAVDYLRSFGSPEKVVAHMIEHKTFDAVSKHAQEFVLFGPWISWKIADMAERVVAIPVDFSEANLFMYKDPVMGAALVKHGDYNQKMSSDELEEVVYDTLSNFGHRMAPPYDDRPVNIQEVETFLCKWKSHYRGSYPLYKDTTEITERLMDWGDLAEDLHTYMLELKPKNQVGD